MYLANMLDQPIYKPVKSAYQKWVQYMDGHVTFWMPDSELHTKAHSSRVLLMALLIAHQKGLSDEDMNTLAVAAVFHDTRRLDDGTDIGHGRRAANYYQEYCQVNNLAFDARAYHIMYYHDQDDALGLAEIAKQDQLGEDASLLYQIFKDADALDRFRLGPDGLDISFLRTEEAKSLVGHAKDLLQQGE